jgi:hypothetical protein
MCAFVLAGVAWLDSHTDTKGRRQPVRARRPIVRTLPEPGMSVPGGERARGRVRRPPTGCHCWLVQQCERCEDTARRASSGTQRRILRGLTSPARPGLPLAPRAEGPLGARLNRVVKDRRPPKGASHWLSRRSRDESTGRVATPPGQRESGPEPTLARPVGRCIRC